MLPERVAADAEANLARIAESVEADLEFVGLPVCYGGDSWSGNDTGSSTFVVYYDPSKDDSGGVFVKWSSKLDIKRLIVSAPELAIRRAIPMGAATLEAMTDVAERVLSTAGWNTDRTNIGIHEASIRVSEGATDSP